MTALPPNSGMPMTRGINFFDADPNLLHSLRCYAAGADVQRALPHLSEVGRVAGSELDTLATLADKHTPVLKNFDENGQRIDEIIYHPAFIEMQKLGFSTFGFAAMSHRDGVLGWPGRVPHVIKFGLSYLFVQAEFGLFCPISMTDSAARVLDQFGPDELRRRYLPGLTSTNFSTLMQSAQLLTERTGGSDVGANECAARQVDGEWQLTGEKWFCSNVGAEVHLTLARPEGAPGGTKGLGMFLVPKTLPDGTRNRFIVRRLKDKLGSRSMPSGEYEFDGAVGYPVGDITRGFAQMAEMINVSRLSNGMRAAALMRRSLLEAITHARGRSAFGKALIDLPLLREQVFDMTLDCEAALSIVLYAARSLDDADAGSEFHHLIVRIVTPLIKYANCRRARATAGMAMNVRGGNGYIEEWVNARLLRDAHLGSIWEGAENVVALDVARAASRQNAHAALFTDLENQLDGLTDPEALRIAVAVRDKLRDTRSRLESLLGADEDTRDARMGAMCDRLAALVCTVLLLREADVQALAGLGYRKLLVANEYRKRNLDRIDPLDLGDEGVTFLDEVIDGGRVPVGAIRA